MSETKSYFSNTSDDDPFAGLGKGDPLPPPQLPPSLAPVRSDDKLAAVLEVSSALESFGLDTTAAFTNQNQVRNVPSRGHSRNASSSSLGAAGATPFGDISYSNTPSPSIMSSQFVPGMQGQNFSSDGLSCMRQSPSVPTLDVSAGFVKSHSRQSSLTGSLPASAGHSRNASVGSLGSIDFTINHPPTSLPFVPSPSYPGQEAHTPGQARRGRPGYVVPPSLANESYLPGYAGQQQPTFNPPQMMSQEPLISRPLVHSTLIGSTNQANTFMPPPLSTGYHQPLQHHWFFKKEVEGKTLWNAFSNKDSTRIEESYLREISGLSTNGVVSVNGGRFDVDIGKRLRYAVYCEEEPVVIRRCGWFYKAPLESRFLPYDESLSAVIEEEYRVSCVTNQWHRQVDLRNGETVNFHSATTVLQFPSKSAGFYPTPSAGDFSNLPSPDYQANSIQPLMLKRSVIECSYSIPEDEDDVVDHLVFLIHGIGSVCDLRFRPVGEVVDSFRELSTQLMSSHFGGSVRSGSVHRVEFLPVNWHHPLHGDDTGIDKRLKPITLASIPKLRFFANDTVLDVLLYTSPVYCETIVSTVVQELNRMYDLFKKRNPRFSGGVSLGGHSLGALILFDILSHQPPPKAESTEGKESVPQETEDGEITPEEAPLDDPSIETICKQLNLNTFLPEFLKEQLDFKTLLLCGDLELKELGLTIGERVRLKTFLRDIHSRRLKSKGTAVNEVHTSSVGYNVSLEGTGQPSIEYPKIDFQPANFFAMGSPIAMFVAVRGIEHLGVDFKLPTCRKMFNIFHPYDPIAYRIESLIDPRLSSLPPVLIPHHKGRKRMHRELKETVTKFSADMKQKFWDGLKNTWATVQTYANIAHIPAIGNLMAGSEESQSSETLEQASADVLREAWPETAGEDFAEFRGSDDPSVLQVPVGCLNGGRRIDYVLQEAPFESVNEYIFAMTSHVCYWQSEDTMLLILKEIYSDIGVNLDVPVQPFVPQQNPYQVSPSAALLDPAVGEQLSFPSSQVYSNPTVISQMTDFAIAQNGQQLPSHLISAQSPMPIGGNTSVQTGFLPLIPMSQPAPVAGASSGPSQRSRRYISALQPTTPVVVNQSADGPPRPKGPTPVNGFVQLR